MTSREIELRQFEWKNLIADKFKELQIAAGQLKFAEDSAKNTRIMAKMREALDEIDRSYGELEILEHEIPEKEDEYDAFGFGSSF